MQYNVSHGVTMNQEVLMPQEEMLEVSTKNNPLIIGIPKENTEIEQRVSLTPQAVEMLTSFGHTVYIEKGAGEAAHFSDMEYSEAGGKITENRAEVFKADIVLKIAPFGKDDIKMLVGKQTIISALHISTQKRELLQELMDKKITALAFEYLRSKEGIYPVVRSMSEIAGYSSIMIASEYLSNHHGGKGVLLGGITGVTPAEVVILGAGTASEYAARTAIGIGALVKIFDSSVHKLRKLQNQLGQRVYTSVLHLTTLSKVLPAADVVISTLNPTSDKIVPIPETLVQKMKKGAIIIDLSIDRGGCFETSKVTTHSKPVFTKHGVIHYCVPNIASRVARTASMAVSDVFAPFLLNLGNFGGMKLHSSDEFLSGVYIFNGILTCEQISKRFTLPYQDLNLLKAAF